MSNSNHIDKVISQLRANPPKVIGGYKRSGWAMNTLEKIENAPVERESDGTVTAKAILLAADQTYYPAFLTLDIDSGGSIVGVYLISESKEEYSLIPLEIARDFIHKKDEELMPFQYRTLEKIDGDIHQTNWPDFS